MASILLICLFLLVLAIPAFWQGLAIRRYRIPSEKVTAPVRLAVLSDLHRSQFGKRQHRLIEAICREKPDAVLLAGDILDPPVPFSQIEPLLEFLGQEYPCFYSPGNHEQRFCNAQEVLHRRCRQCGLVLMQREWTQVSLNGQEIRIAGVADPDFSPSQWENWVRECGKGLDEGHFTLLISHRPERFSSYWQAGFDLTVCGHAHGGQWRIPIILNGLYAPHQGLFPRYGGGLYQRGASAMVVSRGLAKSWCPRIFNPPELVLVEITPVQS